MITHLTIDIKVIRSEFKKVKRILERFELIGEYVSICGAILQRGVEVNIKELEYSMNMMKVLREFKPDQVVSNVYWFNLDQDGYFKRIEILDKIILSLE